MTFTYSPDSLNEFTLHRLRLEIGDTVEGSGVLPGGSNFQDEELIQIIAETGNLYKAAAKLCEMLSTRWTLPNYKVGPVSEEYGKIGEMWADRAAHYREEAAGGANGVVSSSILRVDGYSIDIPSDATFLDSSEYGG